MLQFLRTRNTTFNGVEIMTLYKYKMRTLALWLAGLTYLIMATISLLQPIQVEKNVEVATTDSGSGADTSDTL